MITAVLGTPASGMTWQSEFRPIGEAKAYTLRPDPVMYSPKPQPARKRGYQTLMEIIQMKKSTKLALAAFAPSVVLFDQANAAVSADVTTAISGAGTDAGTVGAAVLVVIVGIFAFKWIRRAL